MQIKKTDASKKHIIVLSDGLTDTADFKSLLSDMTRENISLSTVAVGEGSDIALMKKMARWGSGRYYYTNDADNIPRIFTGETQIVSNNVIIEKKIMPRTSVYSDILGGIPVKSLPGINGMVATYPKPASQTIINTDEGPLLSTWNYGLGKTAVFTSDLSTRWSSHWIEWDYYESFTSQIMKSIQKKSMDNSTQIMIHKEGEHAVIQADILNQEGIYENQLNLEMKVLPPSKHDSTITMKQTAPGRYQGYFPAPDQGEYNISIYAQEKD